MTSCGMRSAVSTRQGWWGTGRRRRAGPTSSATSTSAEAPRIDYDASIKYLPQRQLLASCQYSRTARSTPTSDSAVSPRPSPTRSPLDHSPLPQLSDRAVIVDFICLIKQRKLGFAIEMHDRYLINSFINQLQ
jgi:hypothetical protein